MGKVYKLDEAAEHLRVCEEVLMGLIYSGAIKAFDMTPHSKRRNLRITEEEIENYKHKKGVYTP